jgi:hypothetical protein
MYIKETSGFYKTYRDNKLKFAPNAVRAPTYDLFREDKETYTYPVDGWYWFDTIEDAKTFFGIVEEADKETKT